MRGLWSACEFFGSTTTRARPARPALQHRVLGSPVHCSVIYVRMCHLITLLVDAATEALPKHLADEPREAVDRVLAEDGFLEDDALLARLARQRQLLQQDGESVGAMHPRRRRPARPQRLERNDLNALTPLPCACS